MDLSSNPVPSRRQLDAELHAVLLQGHVADAEVGGGVDEGLLPDELTQLFNGLQGFLVSAFLWGSRSCAQSARHPAGVLEGFAVALLSD